MTLEFDNRGNLIPHEVNILQFDELKSNFVESSRFSESTRKEIFEYYERYLRDLRQLLKFDFFQWIDGSFVTTKNAPRDIDIVSFIDYRDYEKHLEKLQRAFSSQNARNTYRVDAYIVAKYPELHAKHIIYQSDSLYWRNLFGKTRVNRKKQQFAKGIVQLNFSQNG